jgi:hypothetical protein
MNHIFSPRYGLHTYFSFYIFVKLLVNSSQRFFVAFMPL